MSRQRQEWDIEDGEGRRRGVGERKWGLLLAKESREWLDIPVVWEGLENVPIVLEGVMNSIRNGLGMRET
jgi:hypothetical protein